MEEAMRLSREEDERRRRELASQNQGGLFDEQPQCVDFRLCSVRRVTDRLASQKQQLDRHGHAVPAANADWRTFLELQPLRATATAAAGGVDASAADDGAPASSGFLLLAPHASAGGLPCFV